MIAVWLMSALVGWTANASILEYGTIASHAAEQHGRGAYLIEQDVTYKRENESFTVKETWQVLNESEMRLTLEGRGALKGLVGGTMIYTGGSRHFVDGGAQSVRSQRLGEDWLEGFFHFRSSKWLRNRLVALHVTPPESLQDRPPLNAEGPPVYQEPSFLRFGRTGGVTAYAIGIPPTVGIAPTIWLEQDAFFVRKYRSSNQLVLRADEYTPYGDLWYPRTRSYQYGQTTIQIQTLQVKPLGKLPAGDARFKSAALNVQKDVLRLPEPDALREFYARFR